VTQRPHKISDVGGLGPKTSTKMLRETAQTDNQIEERGEEDTRNTQTSQQDKQE